MEEEKLGKKIKWSDGKEDGKLEPTGAREIPSRHEPKFIEWDMEPPYTEEQQEALDKEEEGIILFLDAYRNDDLRKMENAIIKHDLRMEDDENFRALLHSSVMDLTLDRYPSLANNNKMNIALSRSSEDEVPDYFSDDFKPHIDSFFDRGYNTGDYDLMSDIVTEYGCPIKRKDKEIYYPLAYGAIEEGYYDMAKALQEQYSIPGNYVSEYIDKSENEGKTLNNLLEEFEARKNASLSPVSINMDISPTHEASSSSYVDSVNRERSEKNLKRGFGK